MIHSRGQGKGYDKLACQALKDLSIALFNLSWSRTISVKHETSSSRSMPVGNKRKKMETSSSIYARKENKYRPATFHEKKI